MDNREIFKKNFNRLLAESDMNQKDIAKILSVNRSTVSAWATGRGYPRADVMQKISDIFNVKMSELVLEAKPETEEERLLKMFRSLSSAGKSKLLERAEELTVLYGEKYSNVSGSEVV